MKKFTLVRSEVVPMMITTTVEITAKDLKKAIEDVVEGYGKVITTTQEEVSMSYNIEQYADKAILAVHDTNKKLLYNDNDTFANGYNPYKCFE